MNYDVKENFINYVLVKGTVKRQIPKIRMSKKERIKRRWEGRESERFTSPKKAKWGAT